MKLSVEDLRKEIIGSDTFIQTPYGSRLITYADYTASGKTLRFIEKYLIKIQEVYANSHTEESTTGKTMTDLVHLSEKKIKKCLNALDDDYIIPVGTGATGAIQKLANILGVYYSPILRDKINCYIDDRESKKCERDCTGNFFKHINEEKPVVFITPYEHHSNDLIWRESFTEVVEINLDEEGFLDLDDLREKVSRSEYKNRVKIGSISAASNVTGIKSPVYEIAKILHQNNAFACFDFAAGAPYVEINMNKDNLSYFDAVYLSPHKFIGGPGSSGILVINKSLYDKSSPPTVAGGGTVDYVSSNGYDFVEDVEAREMAGTPGILQIIKASLAIELKESITTDVIEEREKFLMNRVFDRLLKNSDIDILGPHDPDKRLAIMSFNIKYEDGYFHHKLVTKLLNDLFGIQSRAGCACAGPYGHRLLNVDSEKSTKYRNIVKDGYNSLKPGWVRVNFHYLMTDDEVDFICDALEYISKNGYLFVNEYTMNIKSGIWTHSDYEEKNEISDNFGIEESFKMINEDIFVNKNINHELEHIKYMTEANVLADRLIKLYKKQDITFEDKLVDELRWYPISKTI